MDIQPKEERELLEILDGKIIEWEIDRNVDKVEHNIIINDLIKRIRHIKENGTGAQE